MLPGTESIEVCLSAPTATCQQLSPKEQTWVCEQFLFLHSVKETHSM